MDFFGEGGGAGARPPPEGGRRPTESYNASRRPIAYVSLAQEDVWLKKRLGHLMSQVPSGNDRACAKRRFA